MNILLDTNIIIHLEDTSRILDSSFAEMRRLAAEQQHCLYVHPMQMEDINHDKKTNKTPTNMKKVIVISTSLRPGATHCYLYDGSEGNCILWDTLADFFGKNL